MSLIIKVKELKVRTSHWNRLLESKCSKSIEKTHTAWATNIPLHKYSLTLPLTSTLGSFSISIALQSIQVLPKGCLHSSWNSLPHFQYSNLFLHSSSLHSLKLLQWKHYNFLQLSILKHYKIERSVRTNRKSGSCLLLNIITFDILEKS